MSADVPFLIHLNVAVKQRSIGFMPDGHEDAGTGHLGHSAGRRILESDAGHHVGPEDVFYDRVPEERDFFVLHRSILHNLRCTKLIASMDDRDFRRKLGKEGRFFHRTVAATNHNEFLPSEEKPVAGGTRGDTMAGQPLLIGESNLNRRSTGGDDDGLSLHTTFPVNSQRERLVSEIDRRDIAREELRPKPFCLRSHLLHQLRSHDALSKAWVILNFRGRRELPAGLPPFNEQRREVGSRRIDGGSQSSWTRPDDNNIVHARTVSQRGKRRVEGLFTAWQKSACSAVRFAVRGVQPRTRDGRDQVGPWDSQQSSPRHQNREGDPRLI